MSTQREVIGTGPNGYLAGFDEREVEIWASSLAEASTLARAHFKPSKRRALGVWVALCERADGSQVVHVADF